jgi:hypothetical protein
VASVRPGVKGTVTAWPAALANINNSSTTPSSNINNTSINGGSLQATNINNGTMIASSNITTNNNNNNSHALSISVNTPQVTSPTTNKENYYNSSRRENLLPLNNYEYRNSYKDHYDNQGVRVNPDLIKNFSTTTTTTSINNNFNQNKQINPLVVAPSSQQQKSKVDITPKPASNTNSIVMSKQTPDIELIHPHQMEHLNEIVSSVTSQQHSHQINQTAHEQHVHQSEEIIELEDIKFITNEFLIHRSTFSGDFDNYDIWCVAEDKNYLQKYEPVLLSTGERCHQSTDIVRKKSLFIKRF